MSDDVNESRQVTCDRCGCKLALDDANVVGDGYRCERCLLDTEVDAHLKQAAINDAARRASWDGFGYYGFEPDMKRVTAEVEAARKAPVHDSTDDLSSAQIEPFIEADDSKRAESVLGVSDAFSSAVQPPSRISISG